MPSVSNERGTGRYWYEHADSDPLVGAQWVGNRWERACFLYPDTRWRGTGGFYRDCPGVCLNDDVCARLGKSIADYPKG